MNDWQRILRTLDIGESFIRGEIAVARLSANRFIVLKNGVIYDEHHSHMTIGLAIARALEAITGEAVVAPCSDCGQPRTVRSYCNACASARVQESKHRDHSL